MKHTILTVLFAVAALVASVPTHAQKEAASMAGKKWSFQGPHNEQANYPKPREGSSFDTSPPGFCWWRVIDKDGSPADAAQAKYLLKILDAKGKTVYQSDILNITAHVPDKVLKPGVYTWTVDALGPRGGLIDTWPATTFTIESGAFEQPWVPAKDLLARVPREHPRCIFLKKDLPQVRKTLETTRAEAYGELMRAARGALRSEMPVEPTYGQLYQTDPRGARMLYHQEVGKLTRILESRMNPLALAYLLSGEEEYGQKARKMLMEVVSWDPSGVTSWYQRGGGHGPSLRIFRVIAQTYDWIYDLLSEEERAACKKNLLYRGNEMLKALRHQDFYYKTGSSHFGRIICYIGEFAVALAEEPDAEAWLDYSIRGIMTSFPHWGGQGGGWNEGMGYALAYNSLHTPPMISISNATGFDVWQHPYFKKARYFFMYCVNLRGEIKPFGDGEQGAVGSGAGIAGLLFFHANKYDDPATMWYIRQFRESDGTPPEISWRPGVFVENAVEPRKPDDLPNARFFPGIGWAAMHSNLADPDNDLHLMFKSSPYGSVSHSYADQNTFTVMKGGAALASLSGHYWPTYGAPFHAEYTRQTMSKNGILVDGKGQIVRERSARGELVATSDSRYVAYACGEAQEAYGPLLERYRRHALLVRPNMIVIVDDLQAPKPSEFQWLFQTKQKLDKMDEAAQSFVSKRKGEAMRVYLATPGGFSFQQTDEWVVEPTKGYEDKMKERGGKIPPKQWHFTATTHEKAARRRIAAIMLVAEDGVYPECEIAHEGDRVTARTTMPGPAAEVAIDLSTTGGDAPLIEVEVRPESGEPERLRIAP